MDKNQGMKRTMGTETSTKDAKVKSKLHENGRRRGTHRMMANNNEKRETEAKISKRNEIGTELVVWHRQTHSN
jgi:hypothetical protein